MQEEHKIFMQEYEKYGNNNVPASFPNNNINKGRWTQEEHKIFMEECEKYGNNCMQIARVPRTQTPAQVKKKAECFFKQNVNKVLQQ